MQELMLRPTIYRFQTCQEFVDQYHIGEGDLILTNEFIYEPFFTSMNLGCDVLYQEKYGTGEPTDVMAEAIARDMNPNAKRIIAIGGGTIIDIAKILALDSILPIEDLYDGKLPIKRTKELVLVPTTCGTGSPHGLFRGLPSCQQLRRYFFWKCRLRGCSCFKLSVRRYLPCSTR